MPACLHALPFPYRCVAYVYVPCRQLPRGAFVFSLFFAPLPHSFPLSHVSDALFLRNRPFACFCPMTDPPFLSSRSFPPYGMSQTAMSLAHDYPGGLLSSPCLAFFLPFSLLISFSGSPLSCFPRPPSLCLTLLPSLLLCVLPGWLLLSLCLVVVFDAHPSLPPSLPSR